MQRSCIWFLLVPLLGGCKSTVQVDVDCSNLCLVEPGPPLPGIARFLPKGWDADLSQLWPTLSVWGKTVDGGTAVISGFMSAIADAYPGVSLSPSEDDPSKLAVEWAVEMDFDEILAQVPSSTINLTSNVQLSAMRLTTTDALSFIDSVDIFISQRPKSTRRSKSADGEVSGCQAATAGVPVASYRKADPSSGMPNMEMTIVNGDWNLFDCFNGNVSRFSLRMSIPADAYPSADTPLSLGTCVGVHAHASYP
jgi:hypothetical protein